MDQKHELQDIKAKLKEQIDTNQKQEQRIDDLERITNSQLIWRIDDYHRKFKAAKSGEMDTIFSPEFYTSRNGYRLMASACLNGDGKGKGTHLSVFISVVQGEWCLLQSSILEQALIGLNRLTALFLSSSSSSSSFFRSPCVVSKLLFSLQLMVSLPWFLVLSALSADLRV